MGQLVAVKTESAANQGQKQRLLPAKERSEALANYSNGNLRSDYYPAACPVSLPLRPL